MARPIKSGQEKAIVISISSLQSEKIFMDSKGISPTKIFQLGLDTYKKSIGVEVAESPMQKDLRILRDYYLDSLKPTGSVERYHKAIAMFMEKYDYVKSDVLAQVERSRLIVDESGKTKLEE